MISNLVSRVRDEVARAFDPPDPRPLKGGQRRLRPSSPLGVGGQGLILAVSGGPDSLCLADATLAIAPRCDLKPTIAHLDHGLRDEAAHDDAEFVRNFATERGVPCIIERADVPGIARDRKLSLEVAAREVRYQFLARVADKAGACCVALAHHADDQAETVLLRLIRGTGLAGLRGMQVHSPLPNAPHLIAVRPLLRISRADIEQYCRDQKLQPRRDTTNDELQHARNKIRHELLPLLEGYNPNISSTLTRLADTISSDLEIVEQATNETFARIARDASEGNGSIEMDRMAWGALSHGLQRATLREAVRRLKGDVTNLKYAAIEEARDVLNSDAGIGEIALMQDVRIRVAWRRFVIGKLIS